MVEATEGVDRGSVASIHPNHQIQLSHGQVALVDAEDYDRLSQRRWHAKWGPNTNSYYALTQPLVGGKRRTVYMHREVLGLTHGDGLLADHINFDTLDNRRANLRIATAAQNQINKRVSKNSTSGFKGVSLDKRWSRWRAYINHLGKTRSLGYFSSAIDAAIAYDQAALELYGQFAVLNFPLLDQAA